MNLNVLDIIVLVIYFVALLCTGIYVSSVVFCKIIVFIRHCLHPEEGLLLVIF